MPDSPPIVERRLSTLIPASRAPESRMFTHPSRVVDYYVPRVEEVILPAVARPERERTWTLCRGMLPHPSTSLKAKVRQAWKDPQVLTAVERRDDRIFFDVRSDTDRNPFHVLATAVLFLMCRRALDDAGLPGGELTVVLKAAPSGLARTVFDLLGIAWMGTDRRLFGRYVPETAPEPQDIFPFLDATLGAPFDGYRRDTPKRVFFPRKGAREIENTEEVSAFLARYGFETIAPETLSIPDQWSIARNAEAAVVVHGASWWSFFLSRFGLDRDPATTAPPVFIDLYSPAFTVQVTNELAEAVGARYCAVRGQLTPDMLKKLDFDPSPGPPSPLVDPAPWPFRVSTEAVRRALAHAELTHPAGG
ncbi:MAG TPA: glycosyltransferase family 61 protein [Polyangiaceae bacterium LLY-WYZ-14_1]|nr:glycosyltransferase family 61 protein [Polyangiaceae bacterium LLY-WYZ-14_1]